MKALKTRWGACLLAAGLVVGALTGTAEGAGPWRATIVDAETGQPLEGVVVVAEFTKYTKSFAGTAGGEYYGSDEVVTGSDGRFEIPERNLWNPIRILTEVRVEFTMAKPGYGRADPRLAPTQEGWSNLTWSELLEKDGVVVAMSPLKTRAARKDYYSSGVGRPTGLVPRERIPRWVEAENEERRFLGLSVR